MKYMLMVLSSQAGYEALSGKASEGHPAWTPEEIQAMVDHMAAINNDLAESGELIDANGLSEPAQARWVSVADGGQPVITDGPYGETKELLAGYWVLECESLERVTEIAARVARSPEPAGSPSLPVVIRPIPDATGAGV
ncbi:YciI family protein [Streptomyces sp. PT12]|uniref:YciI family protein n=1 Tax=Streptomyces sp. PT12 TaxID=1510197 RepID=UPI000DE206E1|nr:YciI family protein [Streptomyces sp. PT12]RBM22432.1 hypothetical protein DEH69_04285 [Streptomyces sp. PT12]